MNVDHQSLLTQAQSEVKRWRDSESEAEEYATEVFDFLIDALERAKQASSRASLERHVESIIRVQMDQAPLKKELMPTFYQLVAAIQAESDTD